MARRTNNKLEQEHELWREPHTKLRAFIQYGRLNIEHAGMVISIYPYVKGHNRPAGITVHLRDSGRLIVQPEVSNTLILRKEST